MTQNDIKQQIKDIYQTKGEFGFKEISDLLIELGVVEKPLIQHFEDTLTANGDTYSYQPTYKPELLYLNSSSGKDLIHEPLTKRKNLVLFKEEKINGLINSKSYVEFMINTDFKHLSPPNIIALTTSPEKFNNFLNKEVISFEELSYDNAETFLNNRDKFRELVDAIESHKESVDFFDAQLASKSDYETVSNGSTLTMANSDTENILNFLSKKVKKKIKSLKPN